MHRYILFVLPWFMLCFLDSHGKCIYPVDTLYFESFEQEIPAAWSFTPNNIGDKWILGTEGFGNFTNPGEANWIYLDDQGRKTHDLAQIQTSSYDLSAHTNFAELSFWLNFQEFDKHGSLTVEMFSREEWVTIYKTVKDFEGKVIIDIKDLVGPYNMFRFSYSDGGVDGWGVGIDNLLISGSASICGNDICEFGEDPETCPGDCPFLTDYPDTWIDQGQNMSGTPVSFKNFLGNNSCDDCSQELNLGFPFLFYGKEYTELFINSNGNVSFVKDFVSYVPQSFCLDGTEIIAPFFSDVDLSKGGEISYYQDPENHYVLIYWKEVAFFGCKENCDLRNSFQLLLTDGSIEEYGDVRLPAGTNVVFSYGDMEWTGGAASGGYLGFGGSAATVGINSGQEDVCVDYGVFDKPGYVFFGKDKEEDCLTSGVNHLDYKYLFFDANNGGLATYQGISSLKGVYVGKGIELAWKVDVLEEEGLFVVERMLIGDDYEQYQEIAIVHIDGEEGEEDLYEFSFTDEQIEQGDYSYRVSYLGRPGTNYADSVQVEFLNQVEFADTTQNFAIMSYGPNPLQDQLQVVLAPRTPDTEIDISYTLLDMAGNEYLSGKKALKEINASLTLDTSDLPSGLYVLNIRSQNEKQYIRLAKH